MEAAALSLLLAHQSGILNPVVDVFVPVSLSSDPRSSLLSSSGIDRPSYFSTS
jgi:hypothetical protein